MPSTKKFEYIVVGGGITGASAAYYLSKSGADVALLEKSDLNTQASGRNAGSLHGQIQFEPFEQLGIDWAKSFLPALSFLADSVKVWSTLSGELDTDLETSFHGGIMVAETEEDLKRLHTKVELEKSVGIDSALLNKDELHAKAPYVSKTGRWFFSHHQRGRVSMQKVGAHFRRGFVETKPITRGDPADS